MIKGSCLCGATRFQSTGHALFCVHCHCHWCRRAHGAAFVTWLGVPDDTFTCEGPLTWFASSEHSDRGFCAKCGSTFLYRSKVAPGEMHITLANIDGDPPKKPSKHVFYDAHVSWFEPKDDLPKADRSELKAFAVIPTEPSS